VSRSKRRGLGYGDAVTCAGLHRHGRRVHDHAFRSPHRHVPFALARSTPLSHERHRHGVDNHDHGREHGHRHGLIDDSIKRSRDGIRAVAWSLAVLGAAAIAQAIVFAVSGSVALLADLIHNAGDALTAVPLAIAFTLRSGRAERRAGLVVVIAIFISACVAGAESIGRLVHPSAPSHLPVLAIAGVLGFLGNFTAARIRSKTGQRIQSPALIADGRHARADAYVSAGVIGSAVFVAIGAPIADPLLGLAITAIILRISWQSWRTVRVDVAG
jgi:divalent metal cation (Fe/Co/Zn/Cd) transporter